MGLLDTLKSFLGMGDSDTDSQRSSRRSEVTVEHDPDTASEAAVKGTDDTAGTEEPEPAAAGTDAAGSTESIVEEPPEGKPGADDPVEAAAEPAEAAGPESQAEGDTEDVDAAAGGPDEAAAGSGPTAEGDGPGADDPVDAVKGIGEAYATRLGEAGVETVGDLRDADAAELADETGISEKRIDRWQDAA